MTDPTVVRVHVVEDSSKVSDDTQKTLRTGPARLAPRRVVIPQQVGSGNVVTPLLNMNLARQNATIKADKGNNAAGAYLTELNQTNLEHSFILYPSDSISVNGTEAVNVWGATPGDVFWLFEESSNIG